MRRTALIAVIATIAAFAVLQREILTDAERLYALGLGALVTAKTLVSLSQQPRRSSRAHHMRVGLVVPFYNEHNIRLGRTLGSIARQTRPPDHLFVINDGSSVGESALNVWLPVLRERCSKVTYIPMPENLGKRRALATAIRAMTECDIIVTTDSDCALREDTISELIKPFASASVMAVTGRVSVSNRNKNILTRFQDVLYAAAFLNERAAMAVFGGSVLVCSGAVAAYRRSALIGHLDEFVRKPWMFGEDRHLTNYALLIGKAVIQDTAVVGTKVPETMGHYLRQQTRWQRAFIQNTIWILENFPLTHRVFWISFLRVGVWLSFMLLLVLSLGSSLVARVLFFHGYLIYGSLMTWLHLIRYLEIRGEGKPLSRWFFYLIAPFFSFPQAILLSIIRIYAIATAASRGRGSRTRGIALKRRSFDGEKTAAVRHASARSL